MNDSSFLKTMGNKNQFEGILLGVVNFDLILRKKKPTESWNLVTLLVMFQEMQSSFSYETAKFENIFSNKKFDLNCFM